jgi:hypothetical protein
MILRHTLLGDGVLGICYMIHKVGALLLFWFVLDLET